MKPKMLLASLVGCFSDLESTGLPGFWHWGKDSRKEEIKIYVLVGGGVLRMPDVAKDVSWIA